LGKIEDLLKHETTPDSEAVVRLLFSLDLVRNELRELQTIGEKERELDKQHWLQNLEYLEGRMQELEEQLTTHHRVKAETLAKLRQELARVTGDRNKLLRETQTQGTKVARLVAELNSCQRRAVEATKAWDELNRSKRGRLERLEHDRKALKEKFRRANLEREKVQVALFSQGKVLGKTEKMLEDLRKTHNQKMLEQSKQIHSLEVQLKRYKTSEPDLLRRIRDLEHERTSFQNELKSLEATYKVQVDEMRQQHEVFEKKIRESYKAAQCNLDGNCRDRFKMLESMNETNLRRLKELRTERDNLLHKYNGLNVTRKTHETNVSNLQTQLSRLRTDATEDRRRLAKELEDANEKLEVAKQRQLKLQALIKQGDDERRHRSKLINTLKNEKEMYKKQSMKDYAKLDADYNQRLKELEVEYRTGMGRVKAEMEKQKNAYQKEIMKLDRDRAEVEQKRKQEEAKRQIEVGKLRELIAKLHEQLETSEKGYDAKTKQLLLNSDGLVKETKKNALLLATREKEVDDLHAEIKKLESEKRIAEDKFAKEKVAIERNYHNCQAEVTKLETELAVVRSKMEEQTTRAEVCTGDLNRCLNQKGRFDELAAKNVQIERELKERQVEYDRGQKEVVKYKKGFDEATKQLRERETLLQNVQRQLADARMHEREMRKQVEVMKKAARECQTRHVQCQQQVQSCEKVRDKCKKKKREWKVQLESSKRMGKICQKTLDDASRRIPTLEGQVKNCTILRRKAEDQCKIEKGQCKKFVKNCQDARKREVSVLQATLYEREKELTKSRDEVTRLSRTLRKKEKAYLSEIEVLKQKAASSDNSETFSKKLMRELSDENRGFKGEMQKVHEQYMKEIKRMQDQIRRLESDETTLKKRTLAMEKEVEMLNAQLQHEKKNYSMERTEKQKLIQELRSALKDVERAMKDAQKRLLDTQKRYLSKRTTMVSHIFRALTELEAVLPLKYQPDIQRIRKDLDKQLEK